jgi:outer membrane protein TolC
LFKSARVGVLFALRATLGLALMTASGFPSLVEALQLTPQDVVDLALKQGPDVRSSELTAQQSEGNAEKQRGAYDIILKLSPLYEYNEALTLTGTGNPNDKTLTLLGSIQKKFSSGTSLTLDYNGISQESVLSSFTSNLRRPNAALNALTLTLRQALLQNVFGESDRALLGQLDAQVTIAKLQREESLEEAILNSLSLYWNAYVAETQLRENTAARQKYEELVKAVRRKAGYNLSTPGELPRLEAEFEAADKNVKLSSATFLQSLDTLRTNLQVDPKEPITFKQSTTEMADIPAIPKLSTIDQARLRPVLISKIQMENAERGKISAMSLGRPRLDLVAKARSTGVDESADLAFSKMTSASKPYYALGLELEWNLDSSLYRGTRAEAEAGYQLTQIQFKLAQDQIRDSIANAERTAVANRDSALSSIEIVLKRSRVVKELEGAYRQGRTPLVELIRAFNDLFAAQQERARAVGNYMISLNQWAAVRDELVNNTVSTKSSKGNR